MAWVIRAASEQDRAALRTFECDSGADCAVCAPDGGNVHEREVEEYIRRSALDVAGRRAPHNDHMLLMLEDPLGGLAGVIACERRDLKVKGDEVDAVSLVVAGLRVDLRGEVVAGHRLSSHLLAAAVRALPGPPRLVIGRVAICNDRSRRLLKRHGVELELEQIEPAYLDVVGRSDEVLATLPRLPL